MGAYFLDTSALVKLYHQESGTDVLDSLLHDDDILVISAVARVEFLSALYRKLRKGEIDSKILEYEVELFRHDLEKFIVIPLDNEIVDEAERMMVRYGVEGLRTLDAVQLASVAIYKDRDTIKFVAADKKFEMIAAKAGFDVFNPVSQTS